MLCAIGQGQRDGGRRLPADVHGWLTGGFATGDPREAGAVLAHGEAGSSPELAARPD
jgi:hypothetical protein